MMPIFPVALGARRSARPSMRRKQSGCCADQAVPFVEPRPRDRVRLIAFESYGRMKDIDSGVSQFAGIGVGEGVWSGLPAVEQRPVEREQPEHVDDVRLGHKIDCAGGILAGEEAIGERACKQRHAATQQFSALHQGILRGLF